MFLTFCFLDKVCGSIKKLDLIAGKCAKKRYLEIKVMINLMFNINEAIDLGINDGISEIMKALGITYKIAIPHTVIDAVSFWGCSNVPTELPKCLKIIDISPEEFKGYQFSKEQLEILRNN